MHVLMTHHQVEVNTNVVDNTDITLFEGVSKFGLIDELLLRVEI